MKRSALIVGAIIALGWMTCVAQPADLSPNAQEVIKLTKAHMSDGVIIAYIRNSGAAYNLSGDDILYLNSQGVSQPVISELLHSNGAAAQAPATPAGPAQPPSSAPMVPPPAPPGSVAQPNTPPPSEAMPPEQPPGDSDVNMAYFQSQLSPAGTWIDVPGYGMCWQPRVALENAAWRPYFDAGHWIYTDDGWSWQSDYPWGEIAFHYGRWFHDYRYGWMWRPGYHWGPAWVTWRQAEGAGFCGWAPLPPDARFEVGVGLVYHGRVGLDIDFGLPPSAYVFVPFDHFWAHDYRAWAAPGWRRDALFRSSIVLNGYHFDGGRFVIGGIGRDRMSFLTHHDIVIDRLAIHDGRIARSMEMQHLHSAEERHEIRHDEFMRRSDAIRHGDYGHGDYGRGGRDDHRDGH